MREKVPAGECPDHGAVHGDDVNFNFPNSATCQCGKELRVAGMVEKSKT